MANILVVPQPGLGVDGLAHSAENLERRQIILFGEGFPELHQGSNGGRGRVKLANFVLLDDLPESVVGRVKRGALEDDGRRSVQQGTVCYISMPGNPALKREEQT